MFYIIGEKKQAKEFFDGNRIPYFRYEEQTSPDTTMLRDEDDEKATLYINLEEGTYTLQVMGEEGGVESETDYPDYESALAAYEAVA